MKALDTKTLIANLPTLPGVYQMLDADGEVLYVGKAKNLKKRVTSYFQRNLVDTKTVTMVAQIKEVTYTVTLSESEALLLENNLIKQFKPRYNIVFRDDKSYPYLYLSDHTDFPRMDIYRGAKSSKGRYFGPFPSAGAVRETLTLLQKIFKIRQCTDGFFKLRTRPCLQYFIDRCTAPCVGYVDAETYQTNVKLAVLFLEGKNSQVIDELAKKMEAASTKMDYEAAARYRDQIVSLRRLQERQYVTGDIGDFDVIAIKSEHGVVCIEILYIRSGRLLGNKAFFPKVPLASSDEEVLTAFLPQYYLSKVHGEIVPQKIIVSTKLSDKDWIATALREKLDGDLTIIDTVRGKQRQWLRIAMTNASHALTSHLATKNNFYQRFEALQTALKLPNLPQRIECFDISHTMGEATVGACVVFNLEGPLKNSYRRFNIKDITKGDDYAAMTQALTRHYTRLKKGEGNIPDILMIDGGKGQLSHAEIVLEELQVSGVTILAIAKGPSRKPGLETIYISGSDQPLVLEPTAPALHLLQQIRDEAHRFAIVGHRKQRGKARSVSPLENIPGVGPKRRRELLRQFGGLQELQRASVEQIASVPGIDKTLAELIYQHLH